MICYPLFAGKDGEQGILYIKICKEFFNSVIWITRYLDLLCISTYNVSILTKEV